MKRARCGKGGGRLEPPMTPTIDIVFNLLIFFLLAPTVVGNEGYLTTNLPRSGRDGLPEGVDEPLWIYLESRGPDAAGVLIGFGENRGLGADFRALGAELRDLRARGLAAEVPVRLVPDAAVQHRWVVRAFDTAVAAGFERIQFAVPRRRRSGPEQTTVDERRPRTLPRGQPIRQDAEPGA